MSRRVNRARFSIAAARILLLDLVGWTPSGDLLVDHRDRRRRFRNPDRAGQWRRASIHRDPHLRAERAGRRPRLVAKWSPNGRSIVLARESRGSETFVIEHPLAAVRATTVSR